MTSKQKVQEIAAYVKSNCYDVEMYLDCDKYEKDILKDLERLEMLEKQNKLLNETKDSVNKVLEDLGKINEENIKLKKAIELLKDKLNLIVEEDFFPPAYNDMSDYGEYNWYLEVFDEFIDLKDYEYELLKEVLEENNYESCNI